MNAKLMNDPSNVMRIIARDHGLTQQGGEFVQVGTISLNIEQYFKGYAEASMGTSLNQWITLFDDTEDDEFDGELGEDDEELPMVSSTMKIEKAQIMPATKALASPRRVTESARPPVSATSPVKKAPTGRGSVGANTMNMANLALASPKGNPSKRKTVVVTDSGTKKLINTNELLELQNQN